jgi:phosphohistidine phosphatase
MELYLVQHGAAASKEENPERPLSEEGREQAHRSAAYAARLGVKVAEIRHSDKLRAIQTAEEFERALAASRVQAPGLQPDDDINPLRREVASRENSLMIVGHLPFLARLAAALLARDESLPVVAFQNAGIVRLDRKGDGPWSLCWAMTPEVMP